MPAHCSARQFDQDKRFRPLGFERLEHRQLLTIVPWTPPTEIGEFASLTDPERTKAVSAWKADRENLSRSLAERDHAVLN